LGHLARLDAVLDTAEEVEEVARAVLTDLAELPGVRRVGIALTEGGGRRLRFAAALRHELADGAAVEWCHIDAYDDVPLTEVVRTGRPVAEVLEHLDSRYAGLADRERAAGTRALAAVPLPGTGSPIGGLIVFLGRAESLHRPTLDLLEAAARRTSGAVQRIRAVRYRDLAEELADTEVEAATQAGLGARTAALRLPAAPTAPGQARAFLRRELREWGLDGDLLDTAQLCLSEVVTNAVNHAHTVADVRLSLLDGVLTVLVRDRGGDGEVLEPQRHEDPLAVYGRGLMLVDALADRWGSERDADGTTVWFAMSAHGASAAS
jgi:anti-sigma regulatory factor (Ser/Thr protein kinase)